MNPTEIMEDPARRRILYARPCLIRKRRALILEARTDTIRQCGIDQQAHRHHHQPGHDALGVFQVERSRQKLRGFQEPEAAFDLLLTLVALQARQGRSGDLIAFMGGPQKTTFMHYSILMSCEP